MPSCHNAVAPYKAEESAFREVRAPDGKVCLRVAANALRDLEFQVREGIKAIPRRGITSG